MGLEGRRFNDLETTQLKICTELSSEISESLVRYSVVKVVEAECSELILVKSFINDGKATWFSLNQASAIGICTCSYMTNSKLVFKHMFRAQSFFRYSISYDIGINKNADFITILLPDSTAEPSIENDIRLKSNDRANCIILGINRIREVISQRLQLF